MSSEEKVYCDICKQDVTYSDFTKLEICKDCQKKAQGLKSYQFKAKASWIILAILWSVITFLIGVAAGGA